MTTHIEKLSEDSLVLMVHEMFCGVCCTITPQKRVKTEYQTFVPDVVVKESSGKEFWFEFDGSTHFCDAKTQLRDSNISKYCLEHGIHLIRFPYFVQPSYYVIYALFAHAGLTIPRYMERDFSVAYASGFHDKKIVLPGNFNSYGQKLFLKYNLMLFNQHAEPDVRDIWESLHNRNEPPEIVWGIDYGSSIMADYIQNYPT